MNLYTEHINDKTQSSVKEKLLEYFHVLYGGVFNQIRRRTIDVTGEIGVRITLQIWGKR